MTTQSMILYHHGSSACAAKVRFALAEKQLRWDGIYIDILAGKQFKPEYLAINPKGVVPALEHNGEIIVESTLICEYLEDCFPQHPLYPTSAIDRVKARYWTKAVDEELHPACSALTYVVSHRYTILRNGIGNFEEFLKLGGSEGLAARTMKWQWLQQGLEAPGAADKIRLYVSYLEKMETALQASEWLVGDNFSIADIAMSPYLNRLAALAMSPVWENGRLPHVQHWFNRIQQRDTFQSAIRDWVPKSLQDEMYMNGQRSWPEIQSILAS
ncbi:MAG: glutathione S-transferase family protein [Pseudomonadota bacterium]